MAKKFLTVSTTLSAAVAAAGTFTVGYPAGTDEDSFAGYGHKANAIGNDMVSPTDFTLTFGSASITFTYAASKTTMPAGTLVRIELNLPANLRTEMTKEVVDHPGVSVLTLVRVDLGSPLALDVDGIALSQDANIAANFVLEAAAALPGFVVAGPAPFGRNLQVVSGGADTAVLVITGTDYTGKVLVENITVNGTTIVRGAKAFFTVTQITVTVANTANGVLVGWDNALGLPFYLPGLDDCSTTQEYMNGILAANVGTFVAGVDTAPTATTGDVRGTYLPLTDIPEGSKNFVLFIPSTDPTYQGAAQFAG